MMQAGRKCLPRGRKKQTDRVDRCGWTGLRQLESGGPWEVGRSPDARDVASAAEGDYRKKNICLTCGVSKFGVDVFVLLKGK